MPDVVEVILKGLCVGQAIYNVLHFQRPNDTDFSDLAVELEDGGAASWIEKMMSMLCADYTIASLLCRTGIDGVPGPQVEVPLAATHTGGTGLTSTFLPGSALIKWVTLTGGRSGRGRTYFGPLGSVGAVDGTVSSEVFTILQDLVNLTKARFKVGGADYNGNWQFGVWSPTTSLFHAMEDGVRRSAAKTQRRRQLGVGI
jgi:hypothetical protein